MCPKSLQNMVDRYTFIYECTQNMTDSHVSATFCKDFMQWISWKSEGCLVADIGHGQTHMITKEDVLLLLAK
jgi:hypothetical protein